MTFVKNHWVLITTLILLSGIIGAGVWVFSNVKQSYKQGQTYSYAEQAEKAIKKENYVEAFALLQQAQQVDPSNPEHTLRQADVAFMAGEYKTAVSLYDQFNDKTFAEVTFYNALEDVADLKFSDAITKLDQAEGELNGDHPLTKDRINQTKQAIENIKNEPNFPLQQAKTGKILIEQNTPELAETALRRLLEKEPTYRDAHYLLGLAHIKMGNDEKAQAELSSALTLDSNYEPAREALKAYEVQPTP